MLRPFSIALIAGAVLAASGTAAVAATSTAPDPVDDPTTEEVVDTATTVGTLNNASCGSGRQVVSRYDVRFAGPESGQVTINGWTANYGRDGWAQFHPSNPAITQTYYSLAWLIPDFAEDVPAAVDAVVDFNTTNPDPGSPAASSENGWSESQVTLRTRTVLCLYKVADGTDKARLQKVLDDLVVANLDPNRYYGPPRTKPHNHGVMADRELMNVASETSDPVLQRKAEARLVSQITGGMYDDCGFIREQSNGYQYFHGGLWNTVLRRVETPEFAAVISDQIEKIRQAAYAVTWPSGITPRIGDGEQKVNDDLSLVTPNVKVKCDETGWYSWRATKSGATQGWIMRYGPSTNLHGHADKGQILWWVGNGSTGDAVLADRGLPGKNRDQYYDYAVGDTAHPVLLWEGGASGRSELSTRTRKGVTTATFVMTRGKSTWKRVVVQNSKATRLVVRDTVSGAAGSKPATANMPLDPTWLPTRVNGVFKSKSGKTLKIVCATNAGKTLKPTTKAVLDYQQDASRRAYTVTCTTPGGSQGVKATLTVS